MDRRETVPTGGIQKNVDDTPIRRSRVGSGTTTTTAVMIDCDPLVVVLMTKTRWWLWIA